MASRAVFFKHVGRVGACLVARCVSCSPGPRPQENLKLKEDRAGHVFVKNLKELHINSSEVRTAAPAFLISHPSTG